MKRSINCAISLLLCFAMVFSVLATIPGTATAAEATSGPIISEDFGTTTESGIPEGWVSFSQHGAVTKASGTGFVTAGDDSYYKITYNAENDAHLAGRHHGIGKTISLANSGVHTKIRLSAKVWTNSAASLITRFNYVENGVAKPYTVVKDSQENKPITATTKPTEDNFVREFDLDKMIIEVSANDGTDNKIQKVVTDVQLVLLQFNNQASELYIDDVKLEFMHTYERNVNSGIPVDANDPDCVKNFIKCDNCDALKKDDAYATGVDYVYTNNTLAFEDFETVDLDGMPDTLLPSADLTNNKTTNPYADRGYATLGENSVYKISGTQTVHHGIAVPFSIATNKDGHTAVRVTAKYSGTGSMISRIYVSNTQYFENKNEVANGNAERVINFNLEDAGEATNLLATFWLQSGQDKEIYLDDILIEYTHSYTQNRDSKVPANDYANYIKCDHCDALKVNDRFATGSVVVLKSSSTLVYENFENPTTSYLPSGWTSMLTGNFSTMMETRKESDSNKYYWFNLYPAGVSDSSGIMQSLSLANKGGHTQVRISLKAYFAPGDPARTYQNDLQTTFTIKDGNNNILNNTAAAGNPNSHVMNFANTEPTGTELEWTPLSWVKNIPANAATADFNIIHSRLSTAEMYIDNVIVEYVHTYELNRDSGKEAAAGDCTTPGATFIKCDHCDMLKVNDPHATGETTIPVVKGHTTVLTPASATNTPYYTCSVCEKYFADEAGRNEIEEGSWIIGGGSSTDETTGTTGGTTGGATDETTGTTGGSTGGTTDETTGTTGGSTGGTTDETTGTTGGSDNTDAPDSTGDSTVILLMMVVMVLSVGAMAVVMTGKKRTV